MNIVLWTFIASIAINIVMFVPAFIFKTDKLTDVSYAVTFIVVAIAGFSASQQTPLHTLVFLLVLLWALRLGTFLFVRINKIKKDARFDKMRDKFIKFLQFWLLQGATVFVVMLSSTLGFSQSETSFDAFTTLGLISFFGGLLIESVADAQKYRFNSGPNKGTWIDQGVWRMSRHPNYLGEMMVWVGMYFVVFSSFTGYNMLWALISPLYIISLLLFVSGVPLLERAANKKWGSNKKYLDYKSEVPVLLPTPKSIKRCVSK